MKQKDNPRTASFRAPKLIRKNNPTPTILSTVSMDRKSHERSCFKQMEWRRAVEGLSRSKQNCVSLEDDSRPSPPSSPRPNSCALAADYACVSSSGRDDEGKARVLISRTQSRGCLGNQGGETVHGSRGLGDQRREAVCEVRDKAEMRGTPLECVHCFVHLPPCCRRLRSKMH
jgi:hypothetical protein